MPNVQDSLSDIKNGIGILGIFLFIFIVSMLIKLDKIVNTLEALPK